MTAGARKALGMALICAGLVAYVAAAVTLAGLLPDHWAVKLVYFPLAGVAWVLPLRRLLRWMNRPDDL